MVQCIQSFYEVGQLYPSGCILQCTILVPINNTQIENPWRATKTSMVPSVPVAPNITTCTENNIIVMHQKWLTQKVCFEIFCIECILTCLAYLVKTGGLLFEIFVERYAYFSSIWVPKYFFDGWLTAIYDLLFLIVHFVKSFTVFVWKFPTLLTAAMQYRKIWNGGFR